jgi:hypothetical protein
MGLHHGFAMSGAALLENIWFRRTLAGYGRRTPDSSL